MLVIASPDGRSLPLAFEEDHAAAAWLEALQQAICQANSSFDDVRQVNTLGADVVLRFVKRTLGLSMIPSLFLIQHYNASLSTHMLTRALRV